MTRIRFLPRSVIHAIAAGEVVERPAVVVKELIENALDAKATAIDIAIENGGLDKIMVTDDGYGMDLEDLQLATQRHTTSKIHLAEDLESIATFGFRGEALASMASVSDFSIASKTADQAHGYQISIQDEQLQNPVPKSMKTGTIVTVEKLFGNVPARLKFLQKPQLQFRQILEVIMASALIHPEVSYQVTHDNKLVLSLASRENWSDRVTELLGQEKASFLAPIADDHVYLKLSGFLGAPQIARRSKSQQYLFVNNRPIQSSTISKAVKDSFGSLLEPKAEPVFLLHLELSPRLLDVNIHPRKETVQFMDEAKIIELLQQSISQHLQSNDLQYRPDPSLAPFSVLREPSEPFEPTDRTTAPVMAEMLKSVTEAWQLGPQEKPAEIIQLHQTYLIKQTEKGFLIVDQHAAHERILFEQFKQVLEAELELTEAVELEQSVVLTLSPPERQLLAEHQATFQQLGFAIEPFGNNTFRVTHVPEMLKDRPVHQLISELLDDLAAGKPVKGVASISERTLAYLACRTAVKAGDPLTALESESLIKKLAGTPNRFTCPHGRPTGIEFTLPEIETLFHRR